jgi:hypothetical protein
MNRILFFTVFVLTGFNLKAQLDWNDFYSKMSLNSYIIKEGNQFYYKKEPFSGDILIEHNWAAIDRYWEVGVAAGIVPYLYRTTDFWKFQDPFSVNSIKSFSNGKLIGEKFDKYSFTQPYFEINYFDDKNILRFNENITIEQGIDGALQSITNDKIKREYKNGNLNNISFDDNEIIINLNVNENEIKVTEYNYEKGGKNKTEVSSIYIYKGNSLQSLKNFEDGLLSISHEYDENGFLTKSIEREDKDKLITNYYKDGLLVKSEIKSIYEYEDYEDYTYKRIIDSIFCYQNFNGGVINSMEFKRLNQDGKVSENLSSTTSLTEYLISENRNNIGMNQVTTIQNEKDGWITEYTLIDGYISGLFKEYNKSNHSLIRYQANYNTKGQLDGLSIKREFDEKNKLIFETKGNYLVGKQSGVWEETSWYNGKKNTVKINYD